MHAEDVALSLFAAWMREDHRRRLSFETEPGDGFCRGSDGDLDYAVAVRSLFELEGPGPWWAARRALEEQLAASLAGAYALWLPPGSHLPLEEPSRSGFVHRVVEAATHLTPGQRGVIAMPTQLRLRKDDAEGSYVAVLGGMQSVWAQFTNRVSGSFNLDSRRLLRMPEHEAARQALIDSVAEACRPLAPGQIVTLPAEDHWTLQRLDAGSGFVIVGAPPEALEEPSQETRKRIRRVVMESGQLFQERKALAQVLLILGLYVYSTEENVTVTVRGMDPSAYRTMDVVALVTDGVLKPIFLPPPQALPWATGA